MPEAFFRFHDELNDFLPRSRRGVEFSHMFQGRVSIKDMIESLGVPHTEVDLILVSGEPVGFETIVRDGDRVGVYPASEALAGMPQARPPLSPTRAAPLRDPRFVLDTHLGRLAAGLRLLGFDALYRNDYDDEELARIAAEDRRILLTRDRGLLKRKAVTRGYYVRALNPRRQAQEVVRRFDLWGRAAPFTRCSRCNGRLERVDKAAVADRLPPLTRQHYDEFYRCLDCGQVYWPGAHYARLREFVDEVLEK